VQSAGEHRECMGETKSGRECEKTEVRENTAGKRRVHGVRSTNHGLSLHGLRKPDTSIETQPGNFNPFSFLVCKSLQSRDRSFSVHVS
jgi:hypothetical protein